MGRGRRIWIREFFNDRELHFKDGTRWKIGRKISEKSFDTPRKHSSTGYRQGESQAVYECEQIEGPSVGEEAILKIRMQVPPNPYEYDDPAVPTTKYSGATKQEVHSLRYLNKRGCSVTPKVFNVESMVQTADMPVPGGYLVFILMQKAPGVTLIDYWSYSPDKREKIRRAFREAVVELQRYGIDAADPGPQNIIYDEENNKCYFVDYEHISVGDESMCTGFLENEYFYWGLARREDGENSY